MKLVPVASLLCLLGGCASPQGTGPSHAADELIRRAPTDKERAELVAVRDEVDKAARARLKELDAEIARLERENAALSAQASRGR